MRKRIGTVKKTIVSLIVFAMLLSFVPVFPVSAAGVLTIQPIEDQVGRIIVASENGGVNWGAEPIVVTVYPNDDDAEVSFEIEDESVVTGSLSGLYGTCITLIPQKVGITDVNVTVTLGDQVVEDSFEVTINKYEDTGEMIWSDSLDIPGAGAVTGYVFHPTEKDVLYASTDVGGAWRFNFETKEWENITQFMNPGIAGVGQAAGLGVDPTPGREDWVYLAYGNSGTLLLSKDRGETWVNKGDIGIAMGGNSGNLRSLGGQRIVVIPDPAVENFDANPETNPLSLGDGIPTIYAASMSAGSNGFRVSTDDGTTWTSMSDKFANTGKYTTITYAQDNTALQLVGAAMQDGAYFSADCGVTWTQLPDQPVRRASNIIYHPCRAEFTDPINEAGDRYIFVTYNDNGSNSAGVNDGQGHDGCVFRWKINAKGEIIESSVNVTPQMVNDTVVRTGGASGDQNRMAAVGMSGLSIDHNIPGALIVGTHNTDTYSFDLDHTYRGMETVFRSLDYGETWFPVICGYNMYGNLAFEENAGLAGAAVNGEYATNMWENPENWDEDGNQIAQNATEAWWEPWTFMHWDFAPAINPFDSNNMFMNSGLGTYVTYNLTAMDEIGKNAAVPNAMTAAGLSVEEARVGLFKTHGSGNEMTIEGRKTSGYEDFLINSKQHPEGKTTAAASVKWETAPGLYMTVQKSTALYSPPSGKNIVTSNTWDYSGWAWQDTDYMPWSGYSFGRWIPEEWEYLYTDWYDWEEITNSLDPDYLPEKPDDGNTYNIYAPTTRGISGENTDYPDAYPDIMVTTQRTDWHFNSSGGVIISFDGGLNWHNLPDGYDGSAYGMPHVGYALLGAGNGMPTEALQNTVNGFKTKSDSSAGHVAIGADAKTIVWCFSRYVVVTKADEPLELGQDWVEPVFYNADGSNAGNNTTTRVFADRVDPDVFYAFRQNKRTEIFVSTDGGLTFNSYALVRPEGSTIQLPSSMHTQANASNSVRGKVGVPYEFMITGSNTAPMNVKIDFKTKTFSLSYVIPTGDDTSVSLTNVSHGGYGLGVDGDVNGAIYTYGKTEAVKGDAGTGYGVYRSLDGGQTWTKVSVSTDNPEPAGTEEDPYLNANNAFADVRAVIGDPRVFGRVYLTMGNVAGGLKYGDMVVNLIESPVKVTLDQTSAYIDALEGETLQLTATVTPEDAANRNITWASSNENVATVDENGLVTAVYDGEAIITATGEVGGYVASCAVTVKNVSVKNARAAQAAAEQAQAAAEEALAKAEAAAAAAEAAQLKADEVAAAAAEKQLAAEAAQLKADEAKAAAEAAQVAAEEAQAQADEAAASAAEDKTAAEAAQLKAEAAQLKADEAKAAAEAAQVAAEEAQAQADEAAAAAAEGQTAAEAAQLKADEAKAAAETAAAAAEDAQAAAEAAAEAAEEQNLAAAEAAAEAAGYAKDVASAYAEIAAMKQEVADALQQAQDASEKAEAESKTAQAEREAAEKAALGAARYYALMEISNAANDMDAETLNGPHKPAIDAAVANGKAAVAAATTIDEVNAAMEAAVDAIIAASVECPAEYYIDVPVNAWYHANVDYVLSNCLMNGISEDVFDPDGTLTRAQLVTILYRAENEPGVEGLENPFADVAAEQWYTNAVIWAAENGIVKGVSATEFAPNAPITREQIVTILWRYDGEQKVEEDNLAGFTDAANVSDYAVDAMNWAVGGKLINGVTVTTLEPAGVATRAQFSAIIQRFLEA